MSNNTFLPIALLLVIAIALYFLYGDYLSPKKVDLGQYKELCLRYQNAPAGTHTQDEIQMLVNEINYLLPAELNELNLPLEREVKSCALQLSKQLE